MNLRTEMPLTAAWIDELRAAFGVAEINEQIRRGLRGEPTFHAVEGGREVGTRSSARGRAVSVGEMVLTLPKEKEGGGRG